MSNYMPLMSGNNSTKCPCSLLADGYIYTCCNPWIPHTGSLLNLGYLGGWGITVIYALLFRGGERRPENGGCKSHMPYYCCPTCCIWKLLWDITVFIHAPLLYLDSNYVKRGSKHKLGVNPYFFIFVYFLMSSVCNFPACFAARFQFGCHGDHASHRSHAKA